jgi:ATP-dependent metalloprotease
MKSVINDPGVDVSTLARATPGFSGADLQNMIKCVLSSYPHVTCPDSSFSQAAIQASKEGSRTVTEKHYEWARVCATLIILSLFFSFMV